MSRRKKQPAATTAKTMMVYPSPDLPRGEYLPGIGAAGAELPTAEAEDLIKRGLAVSEPAGWKHEHPVDEPAEPAVEPDTDDGQDDGEDEPESEV